MGLSDLFKKPKEPAAPVHDPAEDYDRSPSQHITIDVDEEYVTINGNQLTMPIRIEMLTELFGEPEKQVHGKVHLEMLDDEDNDLINAMAGQRINFVWNDLGLYAYTNDSKYVTTLMMLLRPCIDHPTPKIFPKNMFGGTFTINGAHWFDSLKPIKTEYTNSSNKKLLLGRHKIYGSFTIADFKDKKRTDKDYTDIQIALDMS